MARARVRAGAAARSIRFLAHPPPPRAQAIKGVAAIAAYGYIVEKARREGEREREEGRTCVRVCVRVSPSHAPPVRAPASRAQFTGNATAAAEAYATAASYAETMVRAGDGESGRASGRACAALLRSHSPRLAFLPVSGWSGRVLVEQGRRPLPDRLHRQPGAPPPGSESSACFSVLVRRGATDPPAPSFARRTAQGDGGDPMSWPMPYNALWLRLLGAYARQVWRSRAGRGEIRAALRHTRAPSPARPFEKASTRCCPTRAPT